MFVFNQINLQIERTMIVCISTAYLIILKKSIKTINEKLNIHMHYSSEDILYSLWPFWVFLNSYICFRNRVFSNWFGNKQQLEFTDIPGLKCSWILHCTLVCNLKYQHFTNFRWDDNWNFYSHCFNDFSQQETNSL